ncbi:MAG: hypothetical protein EXR93_08680 [Gemmatimonadetes bacterium]|nr:hypothetical protein [Gemmatimonadota bacterium]
MKSLLLTFVVASGLGCATAAGGHAPPPTTKPVLPLPSHVLGGSKIPVFPLTNFVVDEGTGWDSLLASRGEVQQRVDSILYAVARLRAPEVGWIKADVVRRAAEQAPGLLTSPDQIATSQLKTHALSTIPEPLRAQLRQLTGIAAGGRYALIPAGLRFTWDANNRRAVADFTIVLADVRLGAVSWSNTLRGFGATPWDAVALAVRVMFP